MKEETQVELLRIAAQMTATTLQSKLYDKGGLCYDTKKSNVEKDPFAIERTIFDYWLAHLTQAIKAR